MKFRALVAGLLLGLAGLSQAQTLDPAGLLAAVNAERHEAGITALLPDDRLQALAREWAVRAAENKSLSHRKDMAGLSKSQGWAYLNENMYTGGGTVDAKRVLRAWMSSPGHRRNLMNTSLTHAGFGYATNKDGETYVVFNGGAK